MFTQKILFSALTFDSCPFMGASCVVSDSDNLWSVRELRSEKKCGTCFSENFNSWMSCLRRSSLVNLHHGFVSRSRQMLLLALQVAKFLPVPVTYDGPFFKFLGPLTVPKPRTNDRATRFHPHAYKNPGLRLEKDTSIDVSLPRKIHQKPVLAYGM